ncbi:hypothetical protein Salat_2157100 [Sesamum alatum]|uniref:Uncharacterized protein n=1 Tax=Sesamum alatum TaxID=300844 RepID=A0AAE1Y216_9LAMI|nr:hypothetical protein Salat_2157100 [Sesamum alatum]
MAVSLAEPVPTIGYEAVGALAETDWPAASVPLPEIGAPESWAGLVSKGKGESSADGAVVAGCCSTKRGNLMQTGAEGQPGCKAWSSELDSKRNVQAVQPKVAGSSEQKMQRLTYLPVA